MLILAALLTVGIGIILYVLRERYVLMRLFREPREASLLDHFCSNPALCFFSAA